MKDENVFNSWLSSRLRTKEPDLIAKKLSDKYKRGIVDFVIWGLGTSVGLECKFISDYPLRDSSKALTHQFTPEQLNFMRQMEGTGNKAFGLVYVDSIRAAHVMPYSYLYDHRESFTKENLILSERVSLKSPSGLDHLVQILFGRII